MFPAGVILNNDVFPDDGKYIQVHKVILKITKEEDTYGKDLYVMTIFRKTTEVGGRWFWKNKSTKDKKSV